MQGLFGKRILVTGGGFIAMMNTPAEVTGRVNLGNPGDFTIAELAWEIVGTSAAIDRRPLPGDDPRQRKPDIIQAESTLGRQPRTMLCEGSTRTIACFDQLFRRDDVILA